jgi:hypothetical protein
MSLFEFVKDNAALIVSVAAAIGVLAAGVRWTEKRLSRFSERWEASTDALLGREEIRHPDTGTVLVPATPGLGKRLADIEQTLTQLATTDDRITRLEVWKDEHLLDVMRRESERHEEAKAMWSALEAIAKAAPGHDALARITPHMEHQVTEQVTRTRRMPITPEEHR